MTRLLLSVFLVLLWQTLGVAKSTEAQQVRVHVHTDTVFVGEHFEASVVVEQQPGGTVSFPDVPSGNPETEPLQMFGDVEIFNARRLPPEITPTIRKDSVVFSAVTFSLDETTFGPVPLTIIADGDTTAVASPATTVFVRTVLPQDAASLHPPSQPMQFANPLWLWVVAGGCVLLILGGVLWLLLRSRRNRKNARPRLAPYPEATSRLEALTVPATNAEVKPFYIELSDLLRTYLARTLNIPALEQTSRELVSDLQTNEHVDESALRRIDAALQVADLVKFADVHPDESSHPLVLEKTREAIDSVEASVHPPTSEDDNEEKPE